MLGKQYNLSAIRWLTYTMFLMFAMTTDAVGVIIPEIIKEFELSHTQAAAFHYVTMFAIAVSGIFLGYLADRIGRKPAIMIGLAIYAASCFLFSVGETYFFFVTLLFSSGLAIGIFKSAGLALVGDITTNSLEHTKSINMVEGFFGIGAIIGPAIVTYLLYNGYSWKYLYIFAGLICVLLALVTWWVETPPLATGVKKVDLRRTFQMAKNKYALGFSLSIALYVGAEAAIYVWMPTLFAEYDGVLSWFAIYSLSIFFILRASGRFMAIWVLSKISWSAAMTLFSGCIFLCYLISILSSLDVAVILLPLSGLFMAMIYPTLNSKGISCFEKHEHGAVAGLILFFTAIAATIGPLAMAAYSDYMGGNAKYGFYLATVFAGLLFIAMLYNSIKKPAEKQLESFGSQ